MTQQQKQKIERWWQSWGFLVKGSGKLVWLTICGIFAGGAAVNEFKHDYRTKGINDVRHDSLFAVQDRKNRAQDSLNRLYVRYEDLRPSAFRSQPSVDR